MDKVSVVFEIFPRLNAGFDSVVPIDRPDHVGMDPLKRAFQNYSHSNNQNPTFGSEALFVKT